MSSPQFSQFDVDLVKGAIGVAWFKHWVIPKILAKYPQSVFEDELDEARQKTHGDIRWYKHGKGDNKPCVWIEVKWEPVSQLNCFVVNEVSNPPKPGGWDSNLDPTYCKYVVYFLGLEEHPYGVWMSLARLNQAKQIPANLHRTGKTLNPTKKQTNRTQFDLMLAKEVAAKLPGSQLLDELYAVPEKLIDDQIKISCPHLAKAKRRWELVDGPKKMNWILHLE